MSNRARQVWDPVEVLGLRKPELNQCYAKKKLNEIHCFRLLSMEKRGNRECSIQRIAAMDSSNMSRKEKIHHLRAIAESSTCASHRYGICSTHSNENQVRALVTKWMDKLDAYSDRTHVNAPDAEGKPNDAVRRPIRRNPSRPGRPYQSLLQQSHEEEQIPKAPEQRSRKRRRDQHFIRRINREEADKLQRENEEREEYQRRMRERRIEHETAAAQRAQELEAQREQHRQRQREAQQLRREQDRRQREQHRENQQVPAQPDVQRKPIEGDCSICWEDMDANDLNTLDWCSKDCGNSFHRACLNRWLAVNSNCPFCRQPLFRD
ncbi:hypothetical protein BDV96DRAFT_603560 [Lophiotrema nucula]|uniref:RING-type domain-containing protein n=1 Tax=Lophiotrema nucula TaxID=690887 RepID=A0A6A5YVR4_9PLEO|nr:hypothetical protein BDV96DRAFT_603560 [Lophiotrema nucula]